MSTLMPAMKIAEPPCWPGAVWIGELDLAARPRGRIKLAESAGYRRARLLVRDQTRPVAFLELDVVDGCLDGGDLEQSLSTCKPVGVPAIPEVADDRLPSITVVICTRNRTALLKTALASVMASDYPDFDVVVVDNASDDAATIEYVEALSDPRVQVRAEPVPGLAVARNTGILAASGSVVAFTDDDVVVDRMWLRRLGEAFATDSSVGCVTGLVTSGELRTPAQIVFEKTLHKQAQWSTTLTRETFDIRQPPPDNPLFPFQMGLYGTGANLALRRAVLTSLGGFDDGLGVGSPAGGGEDIDIFIRVVTAGYRLVYEPAAMIWHRPHHDMSALQREVRTYGLGLGAWMTKVACDPVLAPMALRRAWSAARHLQLLAPPPDVEGVDLPPGMRRKRIAGILSGPVALAKSRQQGRRARPLASDAVRRRSLRRSDPKEREEAE
ncbi:glycosyltransferase family 2 protein [Mycobacterium palustre]|uniref:glycosyltransferase family 2 protein n=1 Tax=Mycobacterium palustre TaxID=153971 RepID=UPI001FE537F4|nr:glycosyltransferase [Mycobacterium palustre]